MIMNDLDSFHRPSSTDSFHGMVQHGILMVYDSILILCWSSFHLSSVKHGQSPTSQSPVGYAGYNNQCSYQVLSCFIHPPTTSNITTAAGLKRAIGHISVVRNNYQIQKYNNSTGNCFSGSCWCWTPNINSPTSANSKLWNDFPWFSQRNGGFLKFGYPKSSNVGH